MEKEQKPWPRLWVSVNTPRGVGVFAFFCCFLLAPGQPVELQAQNHDPIDLHNDRQFHFSTIPESEAVHNLELSRFPGRTTAERIRRVPFAQATVAEHATAMTLTGVNAGLSRIPDLSACPALQTLFLSNVMTYATGPGSPLVYSGHKNKISDLSPLAELTSLRVLFIEGNCIRDLSPLLALPNLQKISIYGNPLSKEVLALQIPELERRGVIVSFESDQVIWDPSCCPHEAEDA